ncbi:DUF2577 family protein [Anaerolentibacter hominis]|uniref:DUF2577 family protein n=1 Tax=Anaerolentibacter hominis TaxID=3079009 RepID=UPI0031B7F7C4
MPNIVEVIKKAAVDAVRQEKPVAVTFGTLSGSKPVTVKIDQKVTLGPEFLIIPHHFQSDMDEKIIKKGDNIIMISLQGGQKFLLLDKVVV